MTAELRGGNVGTGREGRTNDGVGSGYGLTRRTRDGA